VGEGMIGKCDSCGKVSIALKKQSNGGITRKMCPKCCAAARNTYLLFATPEQIKAMENARKFVFYKTKGWIK
jgi:hypothetical protein